MIGCGGLPIPPVSMLVSGGTFHEGMFVSTALTPTLSRAAGEGVKLLRHSYENNSRPRLV
jgi:hypothetical protein